MVRFLVLFFACCAAAEQQAPAPPTSGARSYRSTQAASRLLDSHDAYRHVSNTALRFLTGTQLALGYCDFSTDKKERSTTLVTAFAIWSVGVAFLAGAVMLYSLRRGWVRL